MAKNNNKRGNSNPHNKVTSIGNSRNTRLKNKHKRRMKKKYIGQGK
jgi:hypothetical protein